MASRPRIQVVDDPLAVRREEPTPKVGDGPGTAPRKAHAKRPREPRKKATVRSSSAAAASRQGEERAKGSEWQPPEFDEPLTLVGARLPTSLARSLDRHAQALRSRHGGSQKALPKQDLLAALIWAAGDPEDQAARTAVAEVYDQYRARRLAAESARVLARSGDDAA